jgi:hypothetical protein
MKQALVTLAEYIQTTVGENVVALPQVASA